jgi:hypothetical protein
LKKEIKNAFERQNKTSGCDGIYFALASRNSDSSVVPYFSAPGLHLILQALHCGLEKCELVHLGLGIISHLSAEPSDDERAGTACRVRAYPQRNAGWTWFGQRMAQLHLVLFIIGQRPCLSHFLGRRTSPELGLLDSALAAFQLSLAPD